MTQLMNAATDTAMDAVREVLKTQCQGLPAIVLDSPPGAGKTSLVIQLAAQSMGLLNERCMIVTQTHAQSFDVCRRLCAEFPKLSATLFLKKGKATPDDLATCGNLRVVDDVKQFPDGPCVVVANASKWAWVPEDVKSFDCQIIDEAYQLHDAGFHVIANLARRIVFVGDPGQIDPVVSCDVRRWAMDEAGPHKPCPTAIRARFPEIPRFTLPVSRRLVADTARLLQPAFYPDLPFVALDDHQSRKLTIEDKSGEFSGVLAATIDGASISHLRLPAKVTGVTDEELAQTMVRFIEQLLEKESQVYDRGQWEGIRPEHIGVVCAHVTQVNAIKRLLPKSMSGILVETSNRFQGLERAVMLVQHPLSGRLEASDFHLDAGRLCVMLSRHRVACFVFSRGGADDLLGLEAPISDRCPGTPKDAVFQGWQAHRRILDDLESLGRCFDL